MNLIQEDYQQTLFQDVGFLNSIKEQNRMADGLKDRPNEHLVTSLESFHKRVVNLGTGASQVILFNAPNAKAVSERYLFDYTNFISANQHGRVLLVDCNLVSSKLDQHFQSDAKKSLCDYVENRATVEEIIGKTDCEQVYLIRGGAVEFSSLKLLMSPRFLNLFKDLERGFDYVLLNSCPYHDSIDAFVLAKFLRPIVLLVPGKAKSSDHMSDVYDELSVLKLNVFALRK